MGKYVSIYSGNVKFKTEKNTGGLVGGVAYGLGRAGIGLASTVEGITDILAATGDLITLNPQKAKQRFANSYTGKWQEGLDEWYNPGKGMQVVGDISGGIGQSAGYMAMSFVPYAGAPLIYASIGSQGLSSAVQKTGELGLKELGYGVTFGTIEGLLESKLGVGVQAGKKLGAAILKGTGKNITKSAAMEAGEGAAKTLLKATITGAAREFSEEALAEWFDPGMQRLWGIDKDARANLGNILYAGFIGGVSGGIMGATTTGINYSTAVKVGKALQAKGLDQDLVRRAKSTLQGFDIAIENAEAARVERPTGDTVETREEKRARKEADKRAKKVSKTAETIGKTIEKNIAAYEQMRADPAKANSNATAAVLGELRGNLFLLGRVYEVDTVEAFMKNSSEAERQVFVDAINEAMEEQGGNERYTLEDFDNNKNEIRRRLAGQLLFEEAYDMIAQRIGANTDTESATEAAGEAQDFWAGIAEDADFEALGATSEAEQALMQAARIQGVPNASVGEMLNQFRKGTALTPAEFADGWADGAQNYGRFGFDTKDAEGTAFGRMETEAREAAVKYGREAAEAETKAREEAAKAKKKPTAKAEAEGKEKSKKTSGKETEGKVRLGEGLKGKQIREAFPHEGQFEAYKAAEILSKVLGTDIVIEASMDSTAGRVTNGFYNRSTNEMHININAMRDGKSVALYTLGHEVTHYVREWSSAKYKILSDFVMGKLGGNAKTLIDEKVSLLRSIEDYKDLTVAELNDLAAEEVVADGMELILTDGKVLNELSNTDQSLWSKVKNWITDIISKIKKYYGELSGASKTAQVLRETMDSLDEVERLFTEAVQEAGERTRTAETREVAQGEGENVYSFTPADFEKPITLHDIEVLRSIRRKSINAFTSADIEKAQKWAYKFYKDQKLGTKSPFFRAWFGDWRAYDKTPLKLADIPEYVATNEARRQQRGVVQNGDTSWDIRISREGETNTISHAGANRLSEYGLAGIQSLIKNAILLDSEVHEHHKNNAPNEAITFDHKLYAIGQNPNGDTGLYKITIEEYYQSKTEPGNKKFHNLKYIEKIADVPGGRTFGETRSGGSTNGKSTINYSIADLFAFVKQYDKEFSPKPVNELMLNEDGTPKVFYHGTNAEFTVFDVRKSRIGAFGKGFYLSPSKTNAKMYGSSRIIESYVALQNPYVVEDSLGLDYDTLQKMQDDLGESQRITDKNAMAVLKKHGYDGIVVMNNGRIKEIVVYDPKKIKSATDNIGTFDGTNPDIRYSLGDAKNADVKGNEAEAEPTDRELLAMALEGAVQSEEEYAIVKEYREQASMLDLVEERKKSYSKEASSLERQIKSLRSRMEEEGDPNGFIRKAMDEAIAKKRQAEAMRDEQERILDDATRKLASLRAAKPFRELISREQRRAKAAERKAAKAVEQAEAKVERANERADKQIQKEKERLKEQAEMSSERKEITVRKRQAQRILNNLNTMLYHPTKAKHVPPLMQSLVDYALKRADPKQFGVNRDNIRTMSELAADIDKMKRKTTLTADEQERLNKMEAKYEHLEAETLSVKRQAEALMTAFETWTKETMGDEMVDENMLQGLRDKVTAIDEAPLHQMTLKSLVAVESLYKTIKHRVDYANTTFATEKKLDVDDTGREASIEVAKQKDSKLFTPKAGEWTAKAKAREFIWSNLKPLTAFEVIGSDKLMSLFRNVLNGEDVWVKDVLEGKKVLDEAKKKYGYNKWDLTARSDVTTANGSTVSLTLGERMSLYAYMFREQAEEHLSTGGFVLAPDAKTIGTLKGIKAYEAYLNDQNAYQMRREDIAKMAEGLTQEQKDYARDVQKYLTSLGKKGNEVSLKLYGMEIFNETDYFPIKSERDYLKAQAGKTGDPQIKNRGTFQETTPGANNPIVLEDFMQVTSEHINTMAVYHAFTLPMEDLLRVWNYKPVNYKLDENGNVLLDDTGKPVADNEKEVQYNSLKAEITKKYGKKANEYILQLMRDLNGGARQDSATSLLDKGLTAFKRSATMLSLSTIIQQPTSIFRAMAYVDAKYFKGAKFYDYEVIKKYAPVAAIKQIGGHDTGTGARTVEYINSKEYDSQKEKLAAAVKPKLQGGDPNARAEYFGFLTQKADEVAWRYMFGACVNEQAAKLKKSADSEEVLKAAGERFAEVVRHTQVYDSTLTRSEIMRSKDKGAKLVTAFGAEPTTVVSMMVDAVVKAERGDTRFLRNTAGAVTLSIIINAMAVSLVYAMRDDDEDENLLEKYVESLTGEIIEGFNPLEYLPYARDAMSLLKGYDVERSDMTLIGNLFDQIEMITSSKRSFSDKLFGVSGAVTAFFGIPVTNVYRDAKGAIKTALSFGDKEPVTGSGTGRAIVSGVKGQFNLFFKLFGAREGNAFELYRAALSGDTAHYDRVASRYETAQDAEMALRRELRENDRRITEAAQAKIDGELEVFESIVEQIADEGHFDRNLIIRAVNNEVLSIQDDAKKTTATKDDTVTEEEEADESLYTYMDLADAIDREDTGDFETVYDYLLSYKMEQEGKTEAQAKSAVKSAVTSRYKKRYLEAWSKNDTDEMKRILALLARTGLYGTRNDTAKTVEKWVRDANK